MIAVIPPIAVSFAVYELGAILEFAGVFALIITGILIPITNIAAQKIIPEKSEYDPKQRYLIAIVITSFSSIALIAFLVLFVLSYL